MLIRWVLPALPKFLVFQGLSELEMGIELRERSMCRNGLFRFQTIAPTEDGSSAWTRTRNPPVNSRMLYH
jgi:hypothetical protein